MHNRSFDTTRRGPWTFSTWGPHRRLGWSCANQGGPWGQTLYIKTIGYPVPVRMFDRERGKKEVATSTEVSRGVWWLFWGVELMGLWTDKTYTTEGARSRGPQGRGPFGRRPRHLRPAAKICRALTFEVILQFGARLFSACFCKNFPLVRTMKQYFIAFPMRPLQCVKPIANQQHREVLALRPRRAAGVRAALAFLAVWPSLRAEEDSAAGSSRRDVTHHAEIIATPGRGCGTSGLPTVRPFCQPRNCRFPGGPETRTAAVVYVYFERTRTPASCRVCRWKRARRHVFTAGGQISTEGIGNMAKNQRKPA